MSTSITAEAIVFAINSAIKLSGAIQKAYAQSLRSKQLLLPLPDFDPNIKPLTVKAFFNGEGSEFLEKIDRLNQLHQNALESNLEDNEWKVYRGYYDIFFHCIHGKAHELDVNDYVNLFRIRQWEKGSKNVPRTSVLQLVAGNLVELGIDCLLHKCLPH